MRSGWDTAHAARLAGALESCVYASRLLGADARLVLHGGGNTSVKATVRDITGALVATLHVKGSGADLATIDSAGFTALRMERLLELARLPRMTDREMARELLAARLDPAAPAPSVEALLHAAIPAEFVLHSHADAVLAVTDTREPERHLREVFEDRAILVSYVMPGFDLARRCVEELERQSGPGSEAMVLIRHGLFTFGASAREAYERHVAAVDACERHLAASGGSRRAGGDRAAHETRALGMSVGADQHVGPDGQIQSDERVQPDMLALARLRAEVSRVAGAPMILCCRNDALARAFLDRPDLSSVATRGPITPDHIIRTKRVPLLGGDVERYAADYREYFARRAPHARTPVTMLDPAPRVILHRELGVIAVGRRAGDAAIVQDLYEHTMEVIEQAEQLDAYCPIGERDAFDMEYWELEQAKLARAGAPAPFAGDVALVTGAASGIGRAIARELLARGAAVIGLDVSPEVSALHDGADYVGVEVDVTDAQQLTNALSEGVRRFGGVDVVAVAAGVFGPSAPLAEHDSATWRAVLGVNVDAVAALLGLVHPLLALAPRGGRVVLIGSKNVAAPGPGLSAYSASKAALTQLARVAALEWASDGVRVNVVHPDAVFDTGLWSPELIAERAARYGVTPEAYRRRNLLGVEIRSADVAAVAIDLLSDSFRAVTGAQIPIDGGNERVI